ncbi:MAG: hypothetical protein KF821_07310 [Anaerolineales bacterium]|jgi:hypothetical protein|nr:hypothetical protein [Anaerolineales bacterium]MBX3005619.1 hypothetical protein [Anaerolineales bacterium]MCW5839040.1 hypothetical protein [Anaerolineales bacterium]
MKSVLPTLALFASLAAACAAAPAASATDVVLPHGDGACVATTTAKTTIYSRPSQAADPFASVDGGLAQPVSARTEDGWLGFDPGVAQAANMGPFRLRWFWHEDVQLSGDCAGLPSLWGPEAGYCYDMPMDAVLVHGEPSAAASVLTTLEPGQFAAVLGISQAGWAEIDLQLGNTGLAGRGWVDAQTLNLNGSACGELPHLP